MNRISRILTAAFLFAGALQAASNELRFCLRSDPKTFDPQLVEDDASEAVRYMTAGVLLRVDRATQRLMPELAVSWKVDQGGRRIAFALRQGVTFSDGAPFTADDVAYTMTRLMDPNTHSATADPFRSSAAPPKIEVTAPLNVTIAFAAPVSGLERLFDQVAILSRNSPKKLAAVLGPFYVAEYKPGVDLTLARNAHYWKRDSAGRQLPYLDDVHLYIEQNRDMELVRFLRGELDLINSLEPESFEYLARQKPGEAVDAGPSLDAEMLWFNQRPGAPLPEYKKAWFASKEFRNAISKAIDRDALCKLAYHGHARPAAGPVSPANRFWFDAKLTPPAHDPHRALQLLQSQGFVLRGGTLYDREGHAVEFSVMTNAGNKLREKMAVMIQEDLRAIGIRMNVATLDFPSLIERMARRFDYEACLLGLANVDLDPGAQMNVWLSSAANHQWNPEQKSPATPWEAEIDRLMRAQSAEMKPEVRKQLFDRVQEIVRDEEPFIYLVHKSSLLAASPEIHNLSPAAIEPQAYWNIEFLRKGPASPRSIP